MTSTETCAREQERAITTLIERTGLMRHALQYIARAEFCDVHALQRMANEALARDKQIRESR